MKTQLTPTKGTHEKTPSLQTLPNAAEPRQECHPTTGQRKRITKHSRRGLQAKTPASPSQPTNFSECLSWRPRSNSSSGVPCVAQAQNEQVQAARPNSRYGRALLLHLAPQTHGPIPLRPQTTMLGPREGRVQGRWAGQPHLEPRPINTNDKILSVLTKHHGWLYKITNECFQDHMAGTDTYYFQGEGRQDIAETLVMIDIDCLKSRGLGSKEGAHRFADHLKETYFPDLCFESSTNGMACMATSCCTSSVSGS